MANESTTTTANDITYSAVISGALAATVAEHAVGIQYCREFDITGQPSNAVDVPYFDSDFGSAYDHGTGVDTEFDATQATTLSNTALSTSKYTLTAAEYGIRYEVTDNVQEDSISGINLLQVLNDFMGRALALALTDDLLALFASLSNSYGTTTVDITIANLLAAISGIRRRGCLASSLVGVLDAQQIDDLEGILVSTNAAAAVYALSADRLLGYAPGAGNGFDANRQVMTFRGYPIHSSGLTDTANAAADVVGAIFTPAGGPTDSYATYGLAVKRLPRVETDRDISMRSTKFVMTMRMGVGELVDASGSVLVTDA